MISFSKRSEFYHVIFLFAVSTILIQQPVIAGPGIAGPVVQEESAFAKRMMTMDRNKDGFLTTDEVPKALLKGIAAADRNQDGKWTVTELSSVAEQATQNRAKESASVEGVQHTGRAQTRTRRTGRGPARPTSGVGSPLDAAQILKFALTFDLNKDGALSHDELRKYASALAIRRSRSRQQRQAESPSPTGANSSAKDFRAIPLPETPDRPGPAKEAAGLKSKSKSGGSDPFGSDNSH